MLYKHDHLEKELRAGGHTAQAEILAMKTEGESSSVKSFWANDDDLTTQWTLCRMHLRVMPAGEAPFETTVRTRLNTFKYKGDLVPVLYDPADHDRVVVDYELDAQQQMASAGQSKAAGSVFEAPVVETPPSAPAPTSPTTAAVESLERLAALRASGALTDAEFAAEKAKILAAD